MKKTRRIEKHAGNYSGNVDGENRRSKTQLISGITRVFVEIGVPSDQVQIIIHDIPKNNWGNGGEQTSNTTP